MEAGPLPYAPPPALHRRRRFRRAMLRLAILSIVIWVGARWGPVAWQRSALLYRQRQCLRYTAPPDKVVCSEPLPRAGRMFPFSFAAADPPGISDAMGLHPDGGKAFPGPSGPVLFMHERKTASGRRYLVILRRVPSSGRESWDLPSSYRLTLIEPATVTAKGILRERPVIEVLPRDFTEPPDADSSAPPDTLRFFAGQPDPADASRFTIRYQRGSRAGVLHGILEDPPPYASQATWDEPVLRLEAEEPGG
jgi:hypothetical protein